MADSQSPRLQAVADEEVPLPAERVWEVIGDFAHIRRWAPAVLAEHIETTAEGTLRVLSMPPDGREVRELLHAQERFSYTYRYLGETPNARNLYGTVSVVPVDAARSRIHLESNFDAAAGLGDQEAVANMTRSARGNLKAMKRALGLA
jgi:uncharacterized protein YndB with AHSA1/START domain